MSPLASVCLNVAEDHVDHFGSMDAYVAAKARIFERTQVAAVYNASDPATLKMVQEADVVEGCRAVAFSLQSPGLSELGLVEDILVDRAFVENRATHAQELATTDDVHPQALHNVANALAAAALARAFGVEPAFVRQGLIEFEPAAHRVAHVATVAGVKYINDSKATNCHAAQTALMSFNNVIWIAGGDAKGQSFDELVQLTHGRIKHVLLLGRDRADVLKALQAHAPALPVTEFELLEPAVMSDVVAHAAKIATEGDVVLLAPACASWDIYQNYGHRGEMFAQAVNQLGGAQ
jgi:UDP-N-acetylmuramoylalanine--D-glutamate ligase